VAANTFTDIVGNANTAIAKNTTQIIYLEKQVDIDGNGSDVDLTHWDVSHVSDASQNIHLISVTLLTSQLLISWLKVLAIQNSADIEKQVDIDGNGSDVDLTHWDVSHVSDASRDQTG
jgi:hypothetical protein